MKYCTRCLNPETRPRIVFNEQGLCNACQWEDYKKNIDWKKIWKEFKKLCKKYRKKDFDVIVPCSGGKDGSYVAWKLKNDLKMHPLCVTVSPPIQTEMGRKNLENFRNSGFDLIEVRPNPEKYRELCKKLFIEQGRCKFPFVIGIGTIVARLARQLDIPLVMWGEEGETEYGGTDKYENVDFMDYDFWTNIYHEGIDLKEGWWKRIPKKDFKKLKMTWWSKWENWDPEEHARFASEHTGLQMLVGGAIGTFTNYAQLDDCLQDLHAYEMFLKYGFGRASADASIEIRKGRMTREEGIKITNEIDGQFPIAYLPQYLEYFGMTEEEFWAVIDKHANLNVLQKTDNKERPYILKEPINVLCNCVQAEGCDCGQGIVENPPQGQ